MRVRDFLADQHVAFETILHPPAFTAQKLAHVLHVPGRQVAKCVLLRGPQGFVIAVLPAIHHVDTALLSVALEGPVRLATDLEVADLFRDCEWGVLSPFGTLYGVRTLLDEHFRPEDFLVFESNSHLESVRLRCRDFEALERPRRLAFSFRRLAPTA